MGKDNNYLPDIAIPPAETLIELIYDRNISISQFCDKVDIPFNVVWGIVAHLEPITPDLAETFEKAGYASASFWLNLQHNYEETLKRISK